MGAGRAQARAPSSADTRSPCIRGHPRPLCSNLDLLTATQLCRALPVRFDSAQKYQQRLMFTNPFTSAMKTAPGDFSEGRFA